MTIAKPGIEHVIRFYHRKDDPPISVDKETFGPFLSDAIKNGTKSIQKKLKPQYKLKASTNNHADAKILVFNLIRTKTTLFFFI